MNVTAQEISEFIIRTMTASGDLVTLPKLQSLLLLVQGYYSAANGSPAFIEAFHREMKGPIVKTVEQSYGHHTGPIVLTQGAPPDLPAPLQGIIRGVLRDFGHLTGHQLREMLTTSPLWKVSQQTDNRLEQVNIAAWFRALKPLSKPEKRDWPEVDFPIKHIEKFDHAKAARELEEWKEQERLAQEAEADARMASYDNAISEAERQAAAATKAKASPSPISKLAALFSGKGV